MTPTPAQLYDVVDATWAAAEYVSLGPWLLRDGKGGGKRVSAATASGAYQAGDIALAEAGMRRLGQEPLFMIREGDGPLDADLAARGYGVIDPVVLYLAPVASLTAELPRLAAFALWPPLAIACEIWAEGGIGPERLAVMERVSGPKTAILGRMRDRAAGVGFTAIHDGIAMIHALEVTPAMRRQGTAVNILRASANWAQDHGAEWFSLAVTQANTGAGNLYASLGMTIVGQYHYRQKCARRGQSS